MKRKLSFLSGILMFLIVGGIIAASSSFFTVNYGSVGVVTRFGKITGDIASPGANFKIPFVDNVVLYRTQKITYETSENPGTSSANYTDVPVDTTTLDGQQVLIRYTVRFALDPDEVTWIANNIGTEEDVVEKIVKTESRIYARNIIRKYKAEQLYTGNIEDAQADISEILKTKFEENGVILDEFGIRQIQFQPEYIEAVEAKQIEKEKVFTEQYKAEQEEFRKEQAITRAEGEAEAQRLQQQTLSRELILKLWIEKWDGVLPTYSGSGTPLLQLPSL